MRLRQALLAFFCFGCVIGEAHARIFVLSGDSTPAFSLTNTPPDSAIPGNGVFFSNILGAGQNVAVLNSSFNAGFAPREINEYFASLPGKTSVIFDGPINSSHLANKQLLVIAVPGADFTPSELSVIASFYLAGGSIFALGEAVAIDFGQATNNSINALTAALGVPMSLEQRTFDIGLNFAQIAPHPLTMGVESFRYGATTSVVGGTPLMYTGNNTSFIAVVPEPAALWFPLLCVMTLMRRRATAAACQREKVHD